MSKALKHNNIVMNQTPCQNSGLSCPSLDDCMENLYFFEKVVLHKAKNENSFTDQEMIDMIGKYGFLINESLL